MCSEAELLVRVADGDEKAFNELATGYYHPLYSFFYRMVIDKQYSENLVQETLLRIYRYSKSFDPSKKAKSWIFSIASNVAKDWGAKKANSFEVPFDYTAFPQESKEQAVIDKAVDNEQVRDVIKVLAVLDEKHRQVFVLKHFHDLKYHEIAAVTGVSLGTVKSRMHYACRQLRKLLVSYKGTTGCQKSEVMGMENG